MKSTFSVVGLVLVLLAGVAVGYFLAARQPVGAPSPTPIADDKIVVDAPLPGATVASPFKVTGRARGTWYFEASFPVLLVDSKGTVLAQVPAQALDNWMTTDWVPFEVTLLFDKSKAADGPGKIILKKDNPSGEARFDDSREMTVYFK